MAAIPRDTHPAVEEVHVRLLAQAGPARRLALAASLSQTTMELSRRAVAQHAGRCSPQELAVKVVALWYGEELAERLKTCLENRREG